MPVAPREPSQPDPVLISFLQTDNEAEAEHHLDDLITGQASQLIRKVVRHRLFDASREDIEDTAGEALLGVLKRLRDLRSHKGDEPIADFRGYVSAAACRACDFHIRKKHPQRWSLQNRLRYLLTHQSGFALWETANGAWVAGFVPWSGREKGADGKCTLLETNPAEVERQLRGDHKADLREPLSLLQALFRWAGEPLEFHRLVNAVAHFWGIQDRQASLEPRSNGEADPKDRLADPAIDVSTRLAQRQFVERMWKEILELQPRQRVAVLLNLKDGDGASAIELFPMTGVAFLPDIAAAVGFPVDEFARLWVDLPLDDAVIGQRLGITRQQVINLRKCARERLARRFQDRGLV